MTSVPVVQEKSLRSAMVNKTMKIVVGSKNQVKADADYMFKDGLDMNEAAYKAGLTKNLKVGTAEGLVGIMTKGRLTRKEYTKEAIRTALIHLE